MRHRLFDLIEKKHRSPITWIAAPPGSGKTALVASYLAFHRQSCLWYQIDSGDDDIASFFYYLNLASRQVLPEDSPSLPLLTSEYRYGVTTFARRYFEDLFLRLPPGIIIVFDNYQEISSDSQLHEIMAMACAVLPESLHFISISRSNPPPAMARLRLHNQMTQIGWDELRLSLEESRAIAQHFCGEKITESNIDKLHTQAQGWMAGLVLILHQENKLGLWHEPTSVVGNEIIFDYFADEIFQSVSEESRELLLATAFLPDFTASMAQEMSGLERSEKILDQLLRDNFFITRHNGDTYQYHPLFRQFLDKKAEILLSQAKLAEALRHSADILQSGGHLVEAATLMIRAGDQHALTKLILKAAPSLIAEGRYRTLGNWLQNVQSSQQNPWLRYWTGLCRLPFSTSEAQLHFDLALNGFRETKDAAGCYLAWSGMVEAILHELSDLSKLDPWIDMFDQLLVELDGSPPAEHKNQLAASMFMALAIRQPGHPRLAFWRENALMVLASEQNSSLRMLTGFYLLSYYYWIGDSGAAGRILKEIEAIAASRQASPLAQVTGSLAASWYGWMEGNHQASLQALTDGLEISATSGVRLWDYLLILQGAANALIQGDSDGADGWLGKLAANMDRARGMDIFYYYHERGWQALLRGKPQEALAYQQIALTNGTKVGAVYAEAQAHFGLSQIYHDNAMIPERNQHLHECRRLTELMQSSILEFMIRIAEAHYAMDEGEEDKIRLLLTRAMGLGRAQGYFSITFWRASVMTRLCLRALQEGIEVEYVQRLISTRGLRPQNPPIALDNWPWPLRIFTLGRFSLLRDGQPVSFGKKAPAKVLELLKAIISFGGMEVSEAQLADALWPDSDGDTALQALATTLFRLRKSLDVKDAVIRSEGRISLDPCLCWVDAWSLEQMLSQLSQSGNFAQRQWRMTRLLEMYHGHFLAGDADKPWAAFRRERLRSMMLRAIRETADLQAADSDNDQTVISWYRKGIEIDPLAEELHQGLMLCYQASGQIAQALQVYDQLQKALAAGFAIQPSTKTLAIYHSLMKKNG